MRRVGAGVARCGLVCRTWHDALQGEAFWKTTFFASLAQSLPPDQLTQLTAFTEKRARESNGQSVWKEVYLSAGLATPVALMGASGQGKTALFELLRLNLASSGSASLHKDKQQPHGEVGVPTLDAQECLMSLSYSRRITLIDVPGRASKGVKNFYAGIVGSRCGVLVISALTKELSPIDETKNHPLLAYTMGVKKVIVCVTHMDHPNVYFAQSSYDAAKELVTLPLKRVGFNVAQTHFIPISAITGDNVFTQSTTMSWYKGPTLMQALETVALDPPGLRLDHVGRPARMVVQKVYRRSYRHDTRDVLVGGCIVSGQLSVGDRVVIQPSNVNGDVIVESIESHHQPRRAVLGPHESVAVRLRWLRTTAASDTVSKKEAEAEAEAEVEAEAEEVTNMIAAEAELPRLVDLVERGSVIVPQGGDQPRRVKSFKAQVIIISHPGMLKSGYTPTLRVHTATVPCTFKLISSIDKRTGQLIENDPQSIRSSMACMAELTPKQPLCLDLFSSSGNLGRLCFADLGRTVAVGVVREVTWDASTSVIPCHVARPDRRRVLEQRRQARRARWRARQTEWVTGLRNLPVGALKVTVLSAYIDSQCGWRAENCYVRLGVGTDGRQPTAWRKTGTRGKKCELGFCQKFIFLDVNPAQSTLYVSAHDASRYPDDYGTREIPLAAVVRTKRGWQKTFALDDTPYSLTNSVTLHFYWQAP